MAGPSTIDRLPAEVRELIGRLRGQGRTIEEILAKLQQLDVEVSRSALGRHTQKLDAIGEQIRRSRGIAEALIARFGDQPEHRTARVNLELMHAGLMDLIGGEDGEPIQLDPEKAMLLARALKDLASAHKTDVDREMRMRQALAKEAAGKVEETARAEGLSADTIQRFRQAILGITP